MAPDFLKWSLEFSYDMSTIASEKAHWRQPHKAKLLVPKNDTSYFTLFYFQLFCFRLLLVYSFGQSQLADGTHKVQPSITSFSEFYFKRAWFMHYETSSWCAPEHLLCGVTHQESHFKSLLLFKSKICGKYFTVMKPSKIIMRTDLNEREMSGQVLFLFWWQTKAKIDIEKAI